MGIPTFYTVADIERHAAGHTHWFDRDTKRFFNSRLGFNVYRTANPFFWLFVTSERNSWGNHPRLYSVRSYDSRTREVDTVGEFQGYNSSAGANRAARRIAQTITPNLEDLHDWALAINANYDSSKRRARARGETSFYVDGLDQVQRIHEGSK